MKNREELLTYLKKHYKQVEAQAIPTYIIKLRKTIELLENGESYEEEDLIIDLQSLGFQDIAQQVRRGIYL